MSDRDAALMARMRAFSWPERAPVRLEDAWAFLRAHPLPPDRFELRSAGAGEQALHHAEVALGRALPLVLRQALGEHDGIVERWTNSGPFFAGAAELRGEWDRFEREWQELQQLLDEGELEPGDWQGIGPTEVQLDQLFPLGHEQGGHICFVLDTSRTSSVGEHPVLWFDPETPELVARWLSLGHFLAWIACDARCHPQRPRPPDMGRLFPRRS
ncbi:SMI1/KNR4 family protein [Nannocystis sp. ILAH1]|uniref:SMI1/KNR4 family protein n=1 Tax=Nannocystis sp. ILAH1 TaxID=2996789 RepID=UPI00227098AF|nr:SMI1/KNR4 family protein [Nannocystis sp. ILAH1]MCY0988925.1 SMI1/KNR4 family protein [Nannocystis sp. ILAH1]